MDLRTGDTAEDTRHSLVRCLEEERTGCIVGRVASSGSCFIYVMDGQILAAHSAFDGERILQRLAAWPGVPPEAVAEVRAGIARGDSLSETLLAVVPEAIAGRLLAERFRENIYRFLGAGHSIEFESMEAIFVDNIQVGHESRRLVDELWVLWHEQHALEEAASDVTIRPHRAPAQDDEDALLLMSTIVDGSLNDVLARSPFEPGRTLEVIGRLRAIGSIELQGGFDTSGTDEVPAQPAWTQRADTKFYEGVDVDLAAFADNDTTRLGGSFTAETLDKVEVGEPSLAPTNRSDDRETLPGRDRHTPMVLIETVEADATAAKQAVSLNFSGPRLDDDEARQKLEVLNEVLSKVCEALEESWGPGRGQSRVQLIVEGSPVPFSLIFKGCEIGPEGMLSPDLILRNLSRRPPTEHRHLINRGLSDLIERTLSMANEELEPDRFDSLLESIAGYQAKIRL